MEISGEIHYANVDIDFDVDYLAETLATNHDFVDSTVLHAHVEEYCDGYVNDLVTERVQRVTDHEELRKTIEEIVRAEICVAFAAGHHKMQDRLNGTDIGIKEG